MSEELLNLLLFLASQANSGGGGGGSSIYITSCSINSDSDLMVSLSDGSEINAGKCKGEDGGSPTIAVYSSTASNYQLQITNADGTSFTTPNLIGSGTSSTRYTVFKNSLYTNYVDSIYTVFNSQLKSIQDYINGGKGFCNSENSYSLSYNYNDFGWAGAVQTFSTVPISLTKASASILLYGYSSGATKDGEFIKFIPANLVGGDTNLEKAQSIQTLLANQDLGIININFDYVFATNSVTEAVGLESLSSGDYYIVWTATSDNSRPKINDIVIM